MAASTWRRKRFDKAAPTQLAASIRESGALQPIIALRHFR
jgi:ParB-like chromosome segregation protein Spo0J